MTEQTANPLLSGPGQGDPSLLAWFVKDSSGSNKLITHQLLYVPADC